MDDTNRRNNSPSRRNNSQPSPAPGDGTCLGQTCLKWQANGELSSVDLQHVLDRLLQNDQGASHINECEFSCDREGPQTECKL